LRRTARQQNENCAGTRWGMETFFQMLLVCLVIWAVTLIGVTTYLGG
jgi:hypothetical protein